MNIISVKLRPDKRAKADSIIFNIIAIITITDDNFDFLKAIRNRISDSFTPSENITFNQPKLIKGPKDMYATLTYEIFNSELFAYYNRKEEKHYLKDTKYNLDIKWE